MAVPSDAVNSIFTSENIKGFTCFHLNIRSVRNKEDQLRILLNSFNFNFNLIFLTETWVTSECDIPKLENYCTFSKSRDNRNGGGLLMYVLKGLRCDLMENFSLITNDVESLAVRSNDHMFAAMYRPPDGNLPNFFAYLEDLFMYVNQNELTLILGGDFNINMLETSTPRNTFQMLLDSNGLHCAIKTATRITPDTNTLIDLFITNLAPHDNTGGVIASHISDHLPIFLLTRSPHQRIGTQLPDNRKVRNINQNTLETFHSKLKNINWDSVYHADTPDQAYDKFLCLFKEAYHDSFPLITIRKASRSRKPWISNFCLNLIKKKDKLFKKFLSTRSPHDWELFRQHRNKTNAFLRNAKREYLFTYFHLESHAKADVVWKKINELLNRVPAAQSAIEITVNDLLLKGSELAEAFNDFFVNLVNSSHNPEAVNLVQSNTNSIYLNPTSEHEVITMFNLLKNSNVSDVDDIQLKPVKYTLDIIAAPLAHIYNLAITTGNFPKRMQLSKVIVIHKGGDKNNFSNYRPISILPVFSKALEKIIHGRLESFASKCNLITSAQYGFRKGRSAELALLNQKEIILKAFEEKEFIAGVYVDFSKAFDRLNHVTLLKKLELYGIRGIPLQLLRTYLYFRKQAVVIGDSLSSFKSVNAGVPQGSILGPLLFNFYINDIIKISAKPTFVIYADDTTLLFRNSNTAALHLDINECLHKLHSWSKLNSLEINVNKTKAILFSPKQSCAVLEGDLLLGNNIVEVVDSVKALGVHFHKNMSWDLHINHIITRIARSVGILAKFRFFLPHQIKLKLYNALFLSHLNYCVLVWGKTTTTNLNRLLALQKKALRHIANVDYHAHTKPLFHRFNLVSARNLYSYHLAIRYKQSINNPVNLLASLADLTNRIPIYKTRSTEPYLIPFSRTSYGEQMLRCSVPTLINYLHKQSLTIENTSRAILRTFFVHAE